MQGLFERGGALLRADCAGAENVEAAKSSLHRRRMGGVGIE